MSVKYNVVARSNPGNPAAPPKYYPSVKSSGRTTLRQLARQIAEISTVSSVDTLAVLEALLTLLPRELSDGNIVELGDFGSFRLRAQTEGAESAEAVTARHIIKVLPRFAPGKEFQQALAATTFEKAGE
jgi:predicted histone-like DNA-binding protein